MHPDAGYADSSERAEQHEPAGNITTCQPFSIRFCFVFLLLFILKNKWFLVPNPSNQVQCYSFRCRCSVAALSEV